MTAADCLYCGEPADRIDCFDHECCAECDNGETCVWCGMVAVTNGVCGECRQPHPAPLALL